ncbi:hypothetical protein LTR37_017628 [Vermiconidia calcicola]|uniref:Uncharacterized protein n=1 Tax=Vermiconidia calcicola TaxID=1690605 RepID=A0ACC3MJB5_9PEZI|nr:hypothetical protein LTR37_017628 [Vermiconidia calcicola]
MSHQQYEQWVPHGGIPEYDRRPPQGRRPPPPRNYGPPPAQRRGPPPMRPMHPGAPPQPPPGARYPGRAPPPPVNYPPMESVEDLYDGSAYGGAEYDDGETWPLPARPFAPSDRNNSPGSSPRKVPQSPAASPRKAPPQRPQRPDYEEPILDPPRQPGRVAPANRAYHQAPPPSHHGSGQWTGDGYRSPQPAFPPPQQQQPRPPPSSHSQSSTSSRSQSSDYQYPPVVQQAVYGARNQRPPLGPPPSSRRGPANYYPQIAPVHPIAEETDSMRASIRNASVAMTHDGPHSSYASSNAIPIGIPGYYVQDRGSARSLPFDQAQQGGRPSVDNNHYGGRPSVDNPHYGGRPSVDNSPYGGRPSMDNPSYGGRPSIDNAHYGRPSTDNSHYGGRPSTENNYYMDDSIMEHGQEGSERGTLTPSPEPAALIRQASLGKKSKPTLTTVRSAERTKQSGGAQAVSDLPSQQRAGARPTEANIALEKEVEYLRQRDSDSDSEDDVLPADKVLEAGAGTGAIHGAEKTREPPPRPARSTSDILSSGTGLLDPSSSESEKDIKKKPSRELLAAALPKEQKNRSKPRSPLAPSPTPSQDPRVSQIRSSLERGGALSPSEADELRAANPGMSERGGRRRGPRLNVDMEAVRDAEARGSMTSLPDLIRRATKLASNLDRGRTASRLGMNFWLDGADNGENAQSANGNKRNSSISDILSSFPAPGLRPDGSNSPAPRWSSMLRHSQLPSDSDAGELRRKDKKRGRRCCGMPLWLFVLLLIVVFLLIAAAVLVPVMLLIVIPGQDEGAAPGGVTNKALASCREKLTCQNDGANTLSSDGFCRCVCLNGYTGDNCATQSSAGCTTISIGETTDATVGENMPRLLDNAESDFGIPLDGETLLGLFSEADMSCSAENALVTFSNVGRRKRSRRSVEGNHMPRRIQRRQVLNPTTTDSSGAASSSTRASPSTTTSSSSSSSSSSPSSSGSSSDTELDFARVSVLYIFQLSSSANTAVTAQEKFSEYFSEGQTAAGDRIDASSIALGNGYSCDLEGLRLALGNGTIVGGS